MLADGKKEPRIMATFFMYREDYVSGENKYKSEGEIVVTAEVTSETAGYVRNFVSGTFTPIEEFAACRLLKYNNINSLCDMIAEKYPDYMVCYDKHDTLGVRQCNHSGGAYAFEEGEEDKTSFRKREKHEDVASA